METGHNGDADTLMHYVSRRGSRRPHTHPQITPHSAPQHDAQSLLQQCSLPPRSAPAQPQSQFVQQIMEKSKISNMAHAHTHTRAHGTPPFKNVSQTSNEISKHASSTTAATSAYADPRASGGRGHDNQNPNQIQNQNAQLVEAIRNPSKGGGGSTIEEIIAPANNQGYCEMFARPAGEAVRNLGSGGNAHVVTIPDSESRVLKKGRGLLSLERVPEAEHGKLRPQEILEKVPSWDPQTRRYVCKAEAQTEILLTSLLSDLFERGCSPHFVLHERSFVCPNEPTHIILERLGINDPADPSKNVASLNDLPRLLEMTGYRASDAPQVMVEVLISALHTLAIMQRAFLMQSLDVRADNILFRVFPPTGPTNGSRASRVHTSRTSTAPAYFRDASMAPDETTTLRYTWTTPSSSPAEKGSRSRSRSRSGSGRPLFFSIPNRGLILKMADLGMGGAFGVPLDDGTTTSILSVTQDPHSTKEWASLAAKAKNPNTTSRDTSKTKSRLAVYAREMDRREESRKTWGYDEKFIPGYDAHYLIESMYRLLRKWERENLFPVPKHHLVYALYDRLHLKNPKDPHRRRPALDHVLQLSPLQLLTVLHRVANGKTQLYDANQTDVNKAVQSQLAPYVTDADFSSSNAASSRRVNDLLFQSNTLQSYQQKDALRPERHQNSDRQNSKVMSISLESTPRTPAAHDMAI